MHSNLDSELTAVGIDGCRGGWIAAIKVSKQNIVLHFSPKISGILSAIPENSLVLVDMILGLPDSKNLSRKADQLARKRLGAQGARVFPAPPREAIQIENYARANAQTRASTGKGLSKQSFNLFPKIRELDSVSDSRIRESHPELAFARLNGGHPIVASKKSDAGVAARLGALQPFLQGCREIYLSACNHLPRQKVQPDDVLDALALCAVAQAPESLTALPSEGVLTDQGGRKMQIWF